MTNADVNKLEKDAARLNAREIQTNTKINQPAVIAAIKADFAQFDGLALKSPYTTLVINYAAFDGSSNNAITISVDGGSTIWTTVSAHADHIGKVLYYKARFRILDVDDDAPSDVGDELYTITASTAYQTMRNLHIHNVMQ